MGSFHKRQVKNLPTPILMLKTTKIQIRQRRYQPNLTLPNLTFEFGGYDYWRLWILAVTTLAVLKFGVCGCRVFFCFFLFFFYLVVINGNSGSHLH